ncbi:MULTISPECIES: hypothetical protein [Aerosakkonema]|uniref:hypothetical protein n=1 Tax=Aerosakkonema TaxID=1246629 RepID=UPI0035B7A4A7
MAELILVDSIRRLLAVELWLSDVDKAQEDYLLEASLKINQACTDFALGRTDSETFLDIVESHEMNMDEYLESVTDALSETGLITD